jgi:hypothetical protein
VRRKQKNENTTIKQISSDELRNCFADFAEEKDTGDL